MYISDKAKNADYNLYFLIALLVLLGRVRAAKLICLGL
jgi:hypothetical protein